MLKHSDDNLVHIRSSFYESVSSVVSTAKKFILTDGCLKASDIDIKSEMLSNLDNAAGKPIYGNEEVLKSYMPNEYGVIANVFASSGSNKVDKVEIEKLYLPTVAKYIFIEYIIHRLNDLMNVKEEDDDYLSFMESGGLELYLERLFKSIHIRIEVSGINTLLTEDAAESYFNSTDQTFLPLRFSIPKTDPENPRSKIYCSIQSFFIHALYYYLIYLCYYSEKKPHP